MVWRSSLWYCIFIISVGVLFQCNEIAGNTTKVCLNNTSVEEKSNYSFCCCRQFLTNYTANDILVLINSSYVSIYSAYDNKTLYNSTNLPCELSLNRTANYTGNSTTSKFEECHCSNNFTSLSGYSNNTKYGYSCPAKITTPTVCLNNTSVEEKSNYSFCCCRQFLTNYTANDILVLINSSYVSIYSAYDNKTLYNSTNLPCELSLNRTANYTGNSTTSKFEECHCSNNFTSLSGYSNNTKYGYSCPAKITTPTVCLNNTSVEEKSNYSFCCCRQFLTNYTANDILVLINSSYVSIYSAYDNKTLYNSTNLPCELSLNRTANYTGNSTTSKFEECHCSNNFTSLSGYSNNTKYGYSCPAKITTPTVCLNNTSVEEKSNYSFCCCRQFLTNYTANDILVLINSSYVSIYSAYDNKTLYNSTNLPCELSLNRTANYTGNSTTSKFEECHCSDNFTGLSGYSNNTKYGYTCAAKVNVTIICLNDTVVENKEDYSFCCCRNFLNNFTANDIFVLINSTYVSLNTSYENRTLYNRTILPCELYSKLANLGNITKHEECYCSDNYTVLSNYRNQTQFGFTCPRAKFYIGGFFDLHSDVGIGTLASAKMATEEINNNPLYFPRYELVILADNSTEYVSKYLRRKTFLNFFLSLFYDFRNINKIGRLWESESFAEKVFGCSVCFLFASLICYCCLSVMFSAQVMKTT